MSNKKLIFLRGLPGSGKSDIAKKLVGNGIIHSTDSYLIKNGIYEFDQENIAKYHYYNLMRSIRSMKKGISPIIIDNTNIMALHCINYAEQGKMYGYEIIVIEPDTPWAFDVEELVKRNSHDVPRDTIIDMLQKYEAPDVFKRKLGLK
jgi:predicted kinase